MALAFIPKTLHSEILAESPVVAVQVASSTLPEAPRASPSDVKGKVEYWAVKYGVDPDLAHFIAENESHYRADAVGDLNLTCRRTGEPVRARGVFQITECWHPNVSDAEAFDAETNIKYALELISKGKTTCMSQFSTCREYYSNGYGI